MSDTRFLNGCQVYIGAPAVWVGQSRDNRIRHNEFTGQFMWAASLGWNWAYVPINRSRDNVVEKNHIHDLGTGVLGTHDALYCLGASPGTVLRNNYIHHMHAAAPLFMDPARDDYRLRPESPAFRLGFRPIDLSEMGPRQTR